MFFALQSRLPALFRFRCSMPPRAAALRSRSASHASSSAPAALRSTSSAAPSSKSEVVLLSATSPPQVRRVPARTPGWQHRRVLPVPGQPPPRGAAAARERGEGPGGGPRSAAGAGAHGTAAARLEAPQQQERQLIWRSH